MKTDLTQNAVEKWGDANLGQGMIGCPRTISPNVRRVDN